MLPFLKPKQQTGLVIINRKPDNLTDSEEIDEVEEYMKALLNAIEAKDHKEMAEAFRAAMEACDAPKDEKLVHYDDLNKLAAEEDR